MSVQESNEIYRIQEEYMRRDAEGLSNTYCYTNPAFLFHIQERERALLKMVKEEKIEIRGAKILEVGCGTGHILARFVEFGAGEAHGIDLMQNRIDIGKNSYPFLHLEQGNAAHLPYDDHSFDIVMQFMCLSSVLDYDLRKHISDEMWRVLKPGGTIIFYDIRPSSLMLKILKRCIALIKRLTFCKNNNNKIEPKIKSTPIKSITYKEIIHFFESSTKKIKSVSLDFELASLASYNYLVTYLLALIPSLRTHYLALLHKNS